MLEEERSGEKTVLNADEDLPIFEEKGYQVVCGEFFSHLFEPSVTLKDEKVSVNVACLRRLPDIEYVNLLINQDEKKIAIKTAKSNTMDSFKWCTVSADGRKNPREITCHMFFAKVMDLMGWDPRFRYRMIGKLHRTLDEKVFVFDLKRAEIYERGKGSHKAYYQKDWKNQFGVPSEEHIQMTQLSLFDESTYITVEKEASTPDTAMPVEEGGAREIRLEDGTSLTDIEAEIPINDEDKA